jgi:hypothetical protein
VADHVQRNFCGTFKESANEREFGGRLLDAVFADMTQAGPDQVRDRFGGLRLGDANQRDVFGPATSAYRRRGYVVVKPSQIASQVHLSA